MWKISSKAFRVLQKREAENGAVIEEMIHDYLRDYDYLAPLKPVCTVDFDNLVFNGGQTSCMISEIPSIGSDLRLYEYLRLMRKSKQPAKTIFESYKKLVEWNGFSVKMHRDLNLAPTQLSVGHDNYVLAKVSKEELGLLKIDHTSTSMGSLISDETTQKMKISYDPVFYSRARVSASKIQELDECFERGLREIPEPIPEDEIMALFDAN